MADDIKYPSLKYLKRAAKRRLPHFVWEYLNSGTGDEITLTHNRSRLNEFKFMPSILHPVHKADLSVDFLGQRFDLPFGIAPVGMSGLIWPDAEGILARTAVAENIPYTLSTVACQLPEDLAPHIDENGWFQLYAPRAPEIRADMLKRIKDAGFRALVLTVDLPIASRRERQTASGITQPPVLTPRILAQIALRPKWALHRALAGPPQMPFVASYGNAKRGLPTTEHIGYLLRTSPDLDYVKALRGLWDGPLIIKGILDDERLDDLNSVGVDALWVSNHAGRQFDAAPSSIDALIHMRSQTDLPLIVDSGFETGLDILRAYAHGADYVMMGAPWHYALGAIGNRGPNHLADLLKKDLIANMGQIGINTLAQAKSRLIQNMS
jgi:L-lactate dehydrogenase (cytochrome)